MKNGLAKGKRLGIMLAVTLAALLLVTACAPAPTAPAGEEKVVTIGFTAPLTGYGSSQEQVLLHGMLDYVRYFNEEERIPGVTVEVPWDDSGIAVDRFMSAVERFKERGIFIMYSDHTFGLDARQAAIEKDQIPMFVGNPLKEYAYPPGWYYFRAPTWGEQFTGFAQYIVENWQEERPPRLALMVVDSQFGRQPIPEAAEYAEGLGIEMLPTEFVPYVVLDATVQLLRIDERGADFVYLSGVVPTSGPIMRDAERLGLLDHIQFGASEPASGPLLIEMAGIASEGFLTPKTLPSLDETEIPGVNLMLDKQMEYRGKVVKQDYAPGWVAGAILCEAIRKAVEQVGYENLNGPAVKEGFDSIKDFDVDGLVSITYNPPDDHRGSSKVAVYQVREGRMVRVGDWRDVPMLVPEE